MKGSMPTFDGENFTIENASIFLMPAQRQHPSLWYGVATADSAAWAADRGGNIVCNGDVSSVRRMTDVYRTRGAINIDRQVSSVYVGMNRHVVIAETEGGGREMARPVMSRSSAPDLPAFIFSIVCARPVSARCHWTRPTTLAAPGTGTAIPGALRHSDHRLQLHV
jgi:alkanesulfonate monooxygenase SsuD/methylene tetrahydromethanopterin reductase-like flavin-dependent oxidoreductase (luciferase family)